MVCLFSFPHPGLGVGLLFLSVCVRQTDPTEGPASNLSPEWGEDFAMQVTDRYLVLVIRDEAFGGRPARVRENGRGRGRRGASERWGVGYLLDTLPNTTLQVSLHFFLSLNVFLFVVLLHSFFRDLYPDR